LFLWNTTVHQRHFWKTLPDNIPSKLYSVLFPKKRRKKPNKNEKNEEKKERNKDEEALGQRITMFVHPWTANPSLIPHVHK
jgi:hypothetical protein